MIRNVQMLTDEHHALVMLLKLGVKSVVENKGRGATPNIYHIRLFLSWLYI